MKREGAMHSSGYTGHLFEEEIFGTCQAIKWSGYMRFKEALQLIKRHQPEQPTRTMSKLRTLVARELDVVRGEVGLFTAVGSPLDVFHGTDAVAMFDGKVVTIDATLNPNKDSHKADIIATEADVEQLAMFASRIASQLQQKMQVRA